MKIQFGIIGTGWRAEFYLRIAAACPDRFEVVGVVGRNAARRAAVCGRFGVRGFASAAAMLAATHPRFVVTSVPRAVNPGLLRELAAAGMPVLSETPPAGTLDELRELWQFAAGAGARIQVAEQYLFQPLHAARLALAASGVLGPIALAQVSVAHGYHAFSLLRRFLNAGFANATITARKFGFEIVQGPTRSGPPAAEAMQKAETQYAFVDFDGGKLGLYDFTGVQYMSYIRRLRLIVQGPRGEIVNEEATWLTDPVTPVRVSFLRHEAGPNGNLEGDYLKGIQAGGGWLYRNPLAPGRLSDDEIAVGTSLLRMDRFVETGEPFYPLAEACQDTYLDLACQQALATGQPVRTETQSWAQA